MLAFDTETTGLLKPELAELHLQPSITEIFICKFNWDGEITSIFQTLCQPPVPVSEKITEITGITNKMLSSAPKFIEIYDELCEFILGETDIYAHNCSFDIDMLGVELKRLDLDYRFPWPMNQICTVEKSFPIENKRMPLWKLYKLATGKKIENAHRAAGDVSAMVECIVWMKKQGLL